MHTEYNECRLCPRECKVNRNMGEVGFCGASNKTEVNRIDLHFMEEPIISGKNGSGTVFFTHCTMKCIFCQNSQISRRKSVGKKFSAEELAEQYITLEQKGANNINLVSPTHYMPTIKKSIEIAKSKGLKIPFVYNTSGFERSEIIKSLKGYIDIFLTDYKYQSPYLAKNYSNSEDYPDIILDAIKEMINITGAPVINDDGILQKGTIIRHLMLPEQISDTLKIINKVHANFKGLALFSLMRQYTPMGENLPDELNRTVNDYEYSLASEEFELLGLEGFIQSDTAVGTDKIPNFNL
ncbi:MAG: radical SAM protein [Ruminococcaceae bacterium]|nr:radical SAM protein [Oscillospiraceae bacterium]